MGPNYRPADLQRGHSGPLLPLSPSHGDPHQVGGFERGCLGDSPQTVLGREDREPLMDRDGGREMCPSPLPALLLSAQGPGRSKRLSHPWRARGCSCTRGLCSKSRVMAFRCWRQQQHEAGAARQAAAQQPRQRRPYVGCGSVEQGGVCKAGTLGLEAWP